MLRVSDSEPLAYLLVMQSYMHEHGADLKAFDQLTNINSRGFTVRQSKCLGSGVLLARQHNAFM